MVLWKQCFNSELEKHSEYEEYCNGGSIRVCQCSAYVPLRWLWEMVIPTLVGHF